MQKVVSNPRMSIESKRNRQPTVNPFGYARCLQSYLLSLSLARALCVVQKEFSCNSIHWVSLPEMLVMAPRLRTVSGRAEADTNGAGFLG